MLTPIKWYSSATSQKDVFVLGILYIGCYCDNKQKSVSVYLNIPCNIFHSLILSCLNNNEPAQLWRKKRKWTKAQLLSLISVWSELTVSVLLGVV